MKLFFVVCLCLVFCLSIMAEDNGKDIEEMILANADKDIEKYRKSDVIIEIVNKKGLFHKYYYIVTIVGTNTL